MTTNNKNSYTQKNNPTGKRRGPGRPRKHKPKNQATAKTIPVKAKQEPMPIESVTESDDSVTMMDLDLPLNANGTGDDSGVDPIKDVMFARGKRDNKSEYSKLIRQYAMDYHELFVSDDVTDQERALFAKVRIIKPIVQAGGRFWKREHVKSTDDNGEKSAGALFPRQLLPANPADAQVILAKVQQSLRMSAQAMIQGNALKKKGKKKKTKSKAAILEELHEDSSLYQYEPEDSPQDDPKDSPPPQVDEVTAAHAVVAAIAVAAEEFTRKTDKEPSKTKEEASEEFEEAFLNMVDSYRDDEDGEDESHTSSGGSISPVPFASVVRDSGSNNVAMTMGQEDKKMQGVPPPPAFQATTSTSAHSLGTIDYYEDLDDDSSMIASSPVHNHTASQLQDALRAYHVHWANDLNIGMALRQHTWQSMAHHLRTMVSSSTELLHRVEMAALMEQEQADQDQEAEFLKLMQDEQTLPRDSSCQTPLPWEVPVAVTPEKKRQEDTPLPLPFMANHGLLPGRVMEDLLVDKEGRDMFGFDFQHDHQNIMKAAPTKKSEEKPSATCVMLCHGPLAP